ncbi:hypothetical protein [Citreimonas salinaria]|uniref:Excalibur calcium-binding domain-containing protein n=1 Tax=Citreimonas salinaria TaxID=321339 RepID=A0A1H3JZ37_9RHOB|nr:hypothetical protein [Citreimonas salinaria]SDY45182.1 hypothetical protein SAMN05444340_10872 [Citreimonas salinaria]
MRIFILPGLMALSLAACTTSIPDSGAGVGFGDYDEYAAREAELTGGVPAAPAVESATLGADGSASAGVPEVVSNAAGISAENDFDAVSEERDIAADANLIARNRAQYQVITPTVVPTRPGTETPNIVEYALRTDNPVGTQLYRRMGIRTAAGHQRACAQFAKPDLAQEAFLAAGGPERDRENLDPDGDGFACRWDPTPFRAIRGS